MTTGKGWRPSMSAEEKAKLDRPTGYPFEELFERMGGRPEIYFDREGTPISLADWCEAMQDHDYRVVDQTHVGDLWISTVWVGLDYTFLLRQSHPLIFETIVFDQTEAAMERLEKLGIPKTLGVGESEYERRYAIEAAALKGHREAVAAAEAGLIKTEGEADETDDR